VKKSPKARGTEFESLIVRGFNDTGWPYVERRALTGAVDRGDITGLPGVVVQCKASSRIDLSGWLKEVQQQVTNDQADIGFVVHKRRMHVDPLDQYVTTDLRTIIQLLHEAGR